MANYVLGRFTKEETALMIDAVKNIPDIVSLIIAGRLTDAMNKYNRSNPGD